MSTRERIFAAAMTIFEREGLAGLSMRVVAREAGMSPMGLYRHFASKDALVDSLMLEGFAAWEAIVSAIDEPHPLSWLEQMIGAFAAFALSDRHRFDAAFLLRAKSARKYPHDFAKGHSPAVTMMTARIDAAKAAGLLADKPSQEIALTLSALGQGLVSMERAGRFGSEDDFRSLYDTIMGQCLHGFAIA